MDPISDIVATLGEAPLRRLVGGFYQRVRQDDLIGPMYPADDWEGAEKRLADFLVYRMGGAPTYLEQRGHPRLRARHFPFPIGTAERDRWLELMGQALQEAALPERETALMTQFFAQVADAMRNRPD
jgi:hemoglobin